HSGNPSVRSYLHPGSRSPPYPDPPRLRRFPTDRPTRTSCCLLPRAWSSSPPALFGYLRSSPPGSADCAGIPLSWFHRRHTDCAIRTDPEMDVPVGPESPVNRSALPVIADHRNTSTGRRYSPPPHHRYIVPRHPSPVLPSGT